MGISKNHNFLGIIANVLMQGVTVQELQVLQRSSSAFAIMPIESFIKR